MTKYKGYLLVAILFLGLTGYTMKLVVDFFDPPPIKVVKPVEGKE